MLRVPKVVSGQWPSDHIAPSTDTHANLGLILVWSSRVCRLEGVGVVYSVLRTECGGIAMNKGEGGPVL